ncbi:hypothetical protein V5799_007344, partial [Amblyomma americanum]
MRDTDSTLKNYFFAASLAGLQKNCTGERQKYKRHSANSFRDKKKYRSKKILKPYAFRLPSSPYFVRKARVMSAEEDMTLNGKIQLVVIALLLSCMGSSVQGDSGSSEPHKATDIAK